MKHFYITWILITAVFTIICPAIYGTSADSVGTSWIQRYNGCDTCVTNLDEAHRIGIDQSGNVYVGGYSTIHTGGLYTDMDYCVTKYSPSGDQLWTARYDGPAHSQDLLYDMKVDKSGNVYATGASYEYPSNLYPIYTTVKWNTDGVLQWASHYTGSTRTSRAYGIAIDSAGNSYVTGESFEGGASLVLIATVKYNPNGVQQWVSRYSLGSSQQGIALTADKNGNVYVIGRTYPGTYNDWVTIKYNSQGVEQWHKLYDNGRNDIPAAIVLDPAQNIYVTGASESSGLGGYWNDFLTIKYDPSGNQQWLARYDASIHGPDDSRAMVYDAKTNSIVVTGSSFYNNYYATFLTIKYNADKGDTVWTARYYTPYLQGDGANAITNDTSGNIYVTGGMVGDGSGYDFGTVKYDQNGVQQWAQEYDGALANDFSYAIVTDNLGSVYVTGVSPVPGTGPDYLTVKYFDIPATLSLTLKAYIQGFYNGTVMASDTVTVELHNTNSPYSLVESKKGVLNTSGIGTFNFTSAVNGTPYYIVIKHRNSIETWSASGNSFTSGSLSYDFTSAAAKAFGSNLVQVGSKWCIYSGDINQDGTIDIFDLSPVDNDAENFVGGYVPTDVNGDQSVDIFDFSIVDNSTSLFVGKVTPSGVPSVIRAKRLLEIKFQPKVISK